MVTDGQGNLFVSDGYDRVVRRVTAVGQVIGIIRRDLGRNLSGPYGLATHNGELLIVDFFCVLKVFETGYISKQWQFPFSDANANANTNTNTNSNTNTNTNQVELAQREQKIWRGLTILLNTKLHSNRETIKFVADYFIPAIEWTSWEQKPLCIALALDWVRNIQGNKGLSDFKDVLRQLELNVAIEAIEQSEIAHWFV